MKKNTAIAAASSTSIYLPEDLTIDIQRRLSLPCLRRLCCVSKSCNVLLSNPKFVYEKLFDDTNTPSLMAITDDRSYPRQYVYSFLHYDSLLPIDQDDGATFRKFPGEEPIMVGCQGGLVCLEYRWDRHPDHGRDYGLFNPATGETKMLPRIPRYLLRNRYPKYVKHRITSALTLVEKEDDQYYHYKVVSVHHYYAQYNTPTFIWNRAYVFSSDESSGWRELLPRNSSCYVLPPHLELYKEVPYYGGTRKKKCYWIAKDHLYLKVQHRNVVMVLVSFDQSTEVFEQVGKPLPFLNWKGSREMSVLMANEERLVVFNCEKEVWVMQQLGVEESWCKLFRIKFPYHMRCLRPVGLSKYGKMICTNYGIDNLQVLDVTSGGLHALPFEEKNYTYPFDQLVTYVPSKMLIG
ncbi:Probable F-box protein At5g47300 [Linum grandiflorum]